VRAKLEDVVHPVPGVVRLHGVRLADAETGAEVLRAGAVEIRRRGGLLELELAQPVVYASRAERLVAAAADLLVYQPPDLPAMVTFRAAELTVRRPGFKYVARQVTGGMRLGPQASVFELAFVPMEGGARPARLKVVRDRRGEPGYALTLSTGDAAVACALVAPRAADWLGAEAHLRGSASLWQTGGSWSGQVAGELRHVDLHRLISEHFPHQLTGKARLELEELLIEQGRIAQASGTLQGGPGLISRSLLASAGQALGLSPGRDALPPPHQPLVAYARFACRFTIGREGLVLSGQASRALPGAILVDTYRPLWTEPAVQPQPAAALVRALVPAGQGSVPAAPQAVLLLRWLPLEGADLAPAEDR
jgi:hypothetical protein